MEELKKRVAELERKLAAIEGKKKTYTKNLENTLRFKGYKKDLEVILEKKDTRTPLSAKNVVDLLKTRLGVDLTSRYCGKLLNHLYSDRQIMDKGVKKYYLVEIKH